MNNNFKKIALLLSICGAILVSELNWLGFVMWSISNIIWIQDAIKRKDSEQVVLWGFYLITSLLGIVNLLRFSHL